MFYITWIARKITGTRKPGQSPVSMAFFMFPFFVKLQFSSLLTGAALRFLTGVVAVVFIKTAACVQGQLLLI